MHSKALQILLEHCILSKLNRSKEFRIVSTFIVRNLAVSTKILIVGIACGKGLLIVQISYDIALSIYFDKLMG